MNKTNRPKDRDVPSADEAAALENPEPSLDGYSDGMSAMDVDEDTGPGQPVEHPKDWERTVYNMLFRALGNRKSAKNLLRHLCSTGLSDDRPATVQARDVAREQLVPEEYARSSFARGRELLSAGPDSEDLPKLGASFDPASMEKEVKDVLPREHLGLLELLFVDRRPLAEVGEVFGVSPEFIVTFIAHLVDLIGELSGMLHGQDRPCPHPLRLVRSQLERSLGESKRSITTNESCASCSDAMQFTQSLVALFSRDSRILSLGDDRIVKKALEGPRVRIHDGMNRAFPMKEGQKRDDGPVPIEVPKALPEPNTAAWKATAMVGCALIFMLSFTAFSIMSGPGDTDQPGFKKGLAAMKRDSLGTFSDKTGPAKDLIAHSTLTAGEAPLMLSYHNGIQVEVPPGGSVTVLPNRIKLIKGRMRLRTTEGPSPGFFIAVGDLVARMKEGDVWANAAENSNLRFSLRAGVLDVKDARGRRYRLESSNVMKVASNGTGFVVEEATAEDVAALGGKSEPAEGASAVQ